MKSFAQSFYQNLASFSSEFWLCGELPMALAERACRVYHMAALLQCLRMRPFGDNHLLSLGSDIWEVDNQQALARPPGPSACRMFVGSRFSGESHNSEGHLLDK